MDGNNNKITYEAAGVSVEAGYEAVARMKAHVESTFSNLVMRGIGGFAASIALPEGLKSPVLVSGTDGVGTKLIIAQQMDVHNTVGIDLVAMCANDVACNGASPLFFLDYIACGKNVPERIASIVEGIANGCKMAGASLVGGETAEMPGMYSQDEYDLAGFCVGVVEKSEMLGPERVKEGDVVIALASSGLHSNGYSLVRKAFFEKGKYKLDDYISEFSRTLGEELLEPTKIYTAGVGELAKRKLINACANITGGGFIENIPRSIPGGLCARLSMQTSPPPVFSMLQQLTALSIEEMHNVFNMGVGFVLFVDETKADELLRVLSSMQLDAWLLGDIVKGSGGIVWS
ncbi:MAG: phosphoribosylformylglycinamidine cyclo-ligase [Eubacteriaceae bacterium]|nr:phosphoribosylformylglycinamidine cyclo-ligase [Eubacteriaceae bacterium]